MPSYQDGKETTGGSKLDHWVVVKAHALGGTNHCICREAGTTGYRLIPYFEGAEKLGMEDLDRECEVRHASLLLQGEDRVELEGDTPGISYVITCKGVDISKPKPYAKVSPE